MSVKTLTALFVTVSSFLKGDENKAVKKNGFLDNSPFGYGFNNEHPIDTLNSSNNKSSNNLIQNDNIAQMERSIDCICRMYGINKREDRIKLIERITGTPIGILAKQGDVSNYLVQSFTKAASQVGSNLSKEEFKKQVGKMANDYYIALQTGWELDEFNAKQKQMELRASLNLCKLKNPATNKCYTKAELKNEKIREEAISQYAIECYKKEVKQKINAASSPEEVNAIEQKAIKEELKNYGLMVTNADDDDIDILHEAVPYLYASNRVKGYSVLLESRDTLEARSRIADKSTPEYFMKAFKPDLMGHTMSKDDKTTMVLTGTRYQTFEGRQNFHTKLETALTSIEDKRTQGIPLTPEEMAMEAELATMATGEFLGTVDSAVLLNAQIQLFAAQLNADAYSHGEAYYRDVIGGVYKYASLHPENLSKSSAEFTSIMCQATNNNYQIIAKDIQNNTTTKLNAPPKDIIPTKYKLSSQYSSMQSDIKEYPEDKNNPNSVGKDKEKKETDDAKTDEKVPPCNKTMSGKPDKSVNSNKSKSKYKLKSQNNTFKHQANSFTKHNRYYFKDADLVSNPVLKNQSFSRYTQENFSTENRIVDEVIMNRYDDEQAFVSENTELITNEKENKTKDSPKNDNELLVRLATKPDNIYQEIKSGVSRYDESDIITIVKSSTFDQQLAIVNNAKDSRFITFLIDHGAFNERTIAYLNKNKNLTEAGSMRYEIKKEYEENQQKYHSATLES